ncbi:MAG: ferredoxin oxidoreductase [spirochete symbiont of Stewartia floridana]|nr:MAG: ferredoxin oxidoreductase [spirochete symbiont of Stewartia floridana]
MKNESVNDFVLKIANVNGSGSASANSLIFKAIFRSGIPVSAKNIFPSNIQGLPTWYEVRVNAEGHIARSPRVDIFVAMNPRTLEEDIALVSPGGYFLYDSTWPIKEDSQRSDINYLPIPLSTLNIEAFPDVKTRILMKNITYVGAIAAFLNISIPILQTLLEETYSKKPQLAEANMKAVMMSHDFVTGNFDYPLPVRIEQMDKTDDCILITGNAACALGSIYAGATVAAWYPITPATSITNVFSQLCGRFRRDPETGRLNAAIIQAEDELAAVGIAIGAGWSGARSFTPTSGPGISLMSEFIGFAYYTEIPVVIFDVQRAGPSTGMPTRTQQCDMLTTAYASHGDTKHILLFPADPEECFYFSAEAFDLAEHFQTPVFILSDLDIGMNEWLIPRLKWEDSYKPDRGKVLGEKELEAIDKFYRYLDTDGDEIAARSLPGVNSKGSYFLRGSGHNRYGQYTEKSDEYIEVVDRLQRKFLSAANQVPEPVIKTAPDSVMGVITVGSCKLAVREALSALEEEGIRLDYMRIRGFPFSKQVESFIESHERCFVIEQNRDAQLRSLLILETAAPKHKLIPILEYGGMSLDAEAITAKLRSQL